MTTDERSFLDAHKVYFDQARMNFLHGFSPYVMTKFEEIHNKYVRPGFVLTPWCSECVLDMVNKLAEWYNNILIKESLEAAQIPYRESEDKIIVPDIHEQEAIKAVQKVVDKANAETMDFLFPDDLDTITVQRGETIMDAPIKRSKGRPKKRK